MLGLAEALPPHVESRFLSFAEGGRADEFVAVAADRGFAARTLAHDTPDLRAAVREVAAELRESAADVLLCHGYKANILGRLAARRAGVPAVAVSRGWTWENRKMRAYTQLDKLHLRLMDHVVSVSDGQAAKVARCGVPAARMTTIRNSARLQAFTVPDPAYRDRLFGMFHPSAGVKRVVVAAGRLSPEKGFGVLIDAAAKVLAEDPGAGFVLFGEGDERPPLEARLSALHLAGRFVMPGFTPDLDRYLPWADVVVLSSFTEGLPNVLLEASAAGVPVVGTAVGGVPRGRRRGGDRLRRPARRPGRPGPPRQRNCSGTAASVGRWATRAGNGCERTSPSRPRPRRTCGSSSGSPAAPPGGRPLSPEPAKPVAVSFVIDNLSRAGTESQLLALIRELDRRSVSPSLVLLDGRAESSRELEPTDCPVLRLGITKLVGLHAARAALRLRSFWRDHPPDAATLYFLDSAYFALPVAKLCGVRRVVRVRNNLGYWLTRKHRLLNRLARPFVNAVLTNSETGRQALLDADGLDPARVTVIENGVDLDRFAGGPPPFARYGVVRVGCVANLRPVKNIGGLMRAAKLVLARHPHAVFEVAGDGEERPALERMHAELGLGDRFKLLGSVADVPGFLRSIDVTVLPSHSEGMSNALLEFMAAGRAVVATDVGANARLAENGVRGRIVPPGDDSALAAAVGAIIDDPEAARRHGEAGRDYIAANYGRAAMVERFTAFFERLVEGERPA